MHHTRDTSQVMMKSSLRAALDKFQTCAVHWMDAVCPSRALIVSYQKVRNDIFASCNQSSQSNFSKFIPNKIWHGRGVVNASNKLTKSHLAKSAQATNSDEKFDCEDCCFCSQNLIAESFFHFYCWNRLEKHLFCDRSNRPNRHRPLLLSVTVRRRRQEQCLVD